MSALADRTAWGRWTIVQEMLLPPLGTHEATPFQWRRHTNAADHARHNWQEDQSPRRAEKRHKRQHPPNAQTPAERHIDKQHSDHFPAKRTPTSNPRSEKYPPRAETFFLNFGNSATLGRNRARGASATFFDVHEAVSWVVSLAYAQSCNVNADALLSRHGHQRPHSITSLTQSLWRTRTASHPLAQKAPSCSAAVDLLLGCSELLFGNQRNLCFCHLKLTLIFFEKLARVEVWYFTSFC